MHKILKIALMIIGALLIIDGLGSIIVYSAQPVWPDHSVRIIRTVLGAILILIGRYR